MAFVDVFPPLWQTVTCAVFLYIISVCIYRCYVHPLAKVPGPLLPAITMLYQTYYNSRYYLEIERMHQKYGPIVRINPNEVHLTDPENYDKIYYVGSKCYKSPNFYNSLCLSLSAFGTVTNETHRIRRGAINPMFSRKMVFDLEPVVQDKAQKVCALMQKGLSSGTPVDIHHALRAVSVDVISDYAFDKSYNLLDQPDLGAHFFRMVADLGPAFWSFQLIPSIQALALKLPPWFVPYVSEAFGTVVTFQEDCRKTAVDTKMRIQEGKLSDRQTIFSTLLSEDDKPVGWTVPDEDRLMQEAYSVLAAAADTTGNAMTVAVYNTLNNQEIYTTLAKELEETFPDRDAKLPFIELEKLPFLTATIKESLRLSFGVPGRLARIVPDPGATFNGHYLPPGTQIGMSSWLMHRNPEVFPDPMRFDPKRWLHVEDARRLEKHMVPFGRGSRQCVGMPLAYCELYVTLGTFFRRFPRGLKVHKTTDFDMEYIDNFSSYHVPGRNWLKVIGAES